MLLTVTATAGCDMLFLCYTLLYHASCRILLALLRHRSISTILILDNKSISLPSSFPIFLFFLLPRSISLSYLTPSLSPSIFFTSSRQANLDKFREGEQQFLVCTDLAARGLDIPEIDHVIMFDFPLNPVDYIHR